MGAQADSELTPAFVRSLLAGLLGRDVEVHARTEDLDLPGAVSTFVDAEREVRAMCAADLPFAAFSAAALTVTPPAMAKEAIAAGKLPPRLVEDLREIFNVLSRPFNVPGQPHVVLSEVLFDIVADAALEDAPKPVERLTLDVKVAGYGEGILSLLRF